MQVRELKETEGSVEPTDDVEPEPELSEKGDDGGDSSAAFDVSGTSFDFFDLDGVNKSVEALFMYKNFFNLIPRAVGSLKALKTLKFFGNELNLFPGEVNDLVGLECLQVKAAAAPGLGGLDFGKLKALKELELSRVPIRPSATPILSEITGLKSLTKLSVCHFSIRYLPPEIGQLSNLEFLDLSFNKMKNLPTELTLLNSLLSLEVANNKLVELPSGLSSLKRLENLDLSNNRLTSFECLELESMRNLQTLNLQNNKLHSCCQIPSWICCNLEGNGKDFLDDEFISSTEMDVVECVAEKANLPKGLSITTSSHLSAPSSSHKCISARKSKGWKRRHSLQQRLNSSRKWKVQNHTAIKKAAEACLTCTDELLPDGASTSLVQGDNDENLFSEADDFQNSVSCIHDDDLSAKRSAYKGKCTCDTPGSLQQHEVTSVCTNQDESSSSNLDAGGLQDDCLDPGISYVISKSKRHSDAEPDYQKPRKCRRPTGSQSDISHKYSMLSYCSIDDYLSDGFYDAGRDRPFMPLSSYEKNYPHFSREVILVDRERDEKLDVIAICAQALVSRFKKINGSVNGQDIIGGSDPIQIASLLALFVSDHFGGSDRSAIIQKTRKAVSGSNYVKPFVCTCPTGNDETTKRTTKESMDGEGGIVFNDLCQRGLQYVKGRLNSIVVPIGSLQFGVCRHRALLLKYLCDRIEPPIDCELVRGFLDFSPHAWNVIVIKRGQLWVRMIVDACHPDDIREETDPEYFSRYIPLSRMSSSVLADNNSDCSTLSVYEQIGKTASNTIMECKIGSLRAAAKVRTQEVSGTSPDDIRSFELSCLAEVRLMSSLRHSCIVNYYGHQISSKWVSSSNGKSDVRILQSAIFMEYIEGGSLKMYLENLKETGAKRVPVLLALLIARGVASALAELHDRHIIHRDIKSENVLIDLDEKKDDTSSPDVKLSDFDRAVPLRAGLHSCCIAHTGVPPPNVCVGTPRWMAPEVFRTMTENSLYGLEVDIWSFGCLLGELLTLQIPYSGLSEPDIHDHLKRGKRAKLTEELEELVDSQRELEDLEMIANAGTDLRASENESKMLKFLVSLYHWCTECSPIDRPSANKLHKLLADASSISSSSSLEQDE